MLMHCDRRSTTMVGCGCPPDIRSHSGGMAARPWRQKPARRFAVGRGRRLAASSTLAGLPGPAGGALLAIHPSPADHVRLRP
jgi:hypothetical protein